MVDMGGSYYYTRNHPNIKEGNFFLPDKPTAAEFLLQKGLTTPFVAQNSEAGQMMIMNAIITIIVLKNHYLYETTSRCSGPNGGANYNANGTCFYQ